MKNKFTYYPTVTRGKFKTEGRITDRIKSGEFAKDLELESEHFNPQTDRVMVCGSMAFNKDMSLMLEEHGLAEGSNSAPGSFVIERAFVG